MSDLIRRHDVIEVIKQFSTDNIRLRNGLMELANHIELIPSVDAVEVVRCEDCERWRRYKDDVFGDCAFNHGVTDKYSFCSDGERKTDDTH